MAVHGCASTPCPLCHTLAGIQASPPFSPCRRCHFQDGSNVYVLKDLNGEIVGIYSTLEKAELQVDLLNQTGKEGYSIEEHKAI